MPDMPRPRKPYLHRDVDRFGNVRWYFRRASGQPRIRIRGDFGSPEFEAAYASALVGQPVGTARTVHKASLRWLVDRYRESSDWSRAARATQRWRERILHKMVEVNGDLPFMAITTDDVRKGREARKATPFAANDYLKVIRGLFRWAVEAGHVKADPTQGVSMLPKRTDGHPPWTATDLKAYRDRWPLGTRQRVAMEVIYWTGLRRGDAVALGRQHVGADGVARIRSEKNGRWISIILPAPLLEVLEAGPIGDLTFITGDSGRPLVKESFGTKFRHWCDEAGVKASAHGLRKRAASEAAEAGATDQQLDKMFGWSTPEMSRIYTRGAQDEILAREAQEKRVRNILCPHSAASGETFEFLQRKQSEK